LIHADPEQDRPEPERERDEEPGSRDPEGRLVIEDVLLGDPGLDGLGSIY
jgi:hypothetical protein